MLQPVVRRALRQCKLWYGVSFGARQVKVQSVHYGLNKLDFDLSRPYLTAVDG